MKKNKRYLLTTFALIAGIFLFSCERESESIYDEDDTGAATPTITSVDPPDENWAGVGTLVITGTNFSSVVEENLVFFDSHLGEVLSATTTDLEVRVPAYVADSVQIKLSVQGAFLFAEYDQPYDLKAAAIDYGGFDEYDQLSSIACNSGDTIFVSAFPAIHLIPPDSSKTDDPFIPDIRPLAGAGALKVGPGGYLYLAQQTAVFRYDPEGNRDATWFVLLGGNASDFDFTEDQNILVGSQNGEVYYLDVEAKTSTSWATHADINISAVRVYDGDLYIAGYYVGDDSSLVQEEIWKREIQADVLGDSIHVADWDAFTLGSDAHITCMTFSAAGILFVGSDKDYALLQHDGSEFLPFYEQILYAPTRNMVWGGGDYLYMVRQAGGTEAQRIIQVNMLEPGAPYYGR